MKFIKYILGMATIAIMCSFIDNKDRQERDKHVGKVKGISCVVYHATMDSTGEIYKGDIISDTDEIGVEDRNVRQTDMLKRRKDNTIPIEVWQYDENGKLVEDDRYHCDNKIYHKNVCSYDGDLLLAEYDTSYNKNGIGRTSVTIRQFRADRKLVWQKDITHERDRDILYRTQRYKYDTRNHCTELVVIDSSSSDRPVTYSGVKYELDTAGNPLQTMGFDGDSDHIRSITLYRYNNKGKIIEMDEMGEGQSRRMPPREVEDGLVPKSKTVMSYDSKDRLVDEIEYLPGNIIKSEVKTSFDTSGKKEETYRYDDAGHFQGTDVKTTFKHTHVVLDDKYDIDGMLTEYTISHFDTAKHLIDKGTLRVNYQSFVGRDRRQHNQGPGDTVMVSQIINNEHFDRVEEDSYSDGKIATQKTNQYVYDDHGNWTQNIFFENGKPTKVEEREISYYDK